LTEWTGSDQVFDLVAILPALYILGTVALVRVEPDTLVYQTSVA